jgi:predicted nucleic acid-binding protein
LLGTWCRLALDRLPMAPLLPRVWELRDNLTAYDAVFVAAAEAHGVPLVTGDRGIATAVGPRCRIELIARPA